MNAMMYKGYAARVEFDAEDHIFVGRLSGITDIVTFHGESVEELETEFKLAVDHYLTVSAETGIPPQQAFSGDLILHLPPDIHAHAAIMAEAQGKTLNQWATEVLANARN